MKPNLYKAFFKGVGPLSLLMVIALAGDSTFQKGLGLVGVAMLSAHIASIAITLKAEKLVENPGALIAFSRKWLFRGAVLGAVLALLFTNLLWQMTMISLWWLPVYFLFVFAMWQVGYLSWWSRVFLSPFHPNSIWHRRVGGSFFREWPEDFLSSHGAHISEPPGHQLRIPEQELEARKNTGG